MSVNNAIQVFDDKQVRTVWDADQEKCYFSDGRARVSAGRLFSQTEPPELQLTEYQSVLI